MYTKIKKQSKNIVKNNNILQINLNEKLYQEIQTINFVFGNVNISLHKNGEMIFDNGKAKLALKEDGNVKINAKKNIKLKSGENIFLN